MKILDTSGLVGKKEDLIEINENAEAKIKYLEDIL